MPYVKGGEREVPGTLVNKGWQLRAALMERAESIGITAKQVKEEGRFRWFRESKSGRYSMHLTVGKGYLAQNFTVVADSEPRTAAEVSEMRESFKKRKNRRRRSAAGQKAAKTRKKNAAAKTNSQPKEIANVVSLSPKELLDAYDDLLAAQAKLQSLGARVTVTIV